MAILGLAFLFLIVFPGLLYAVAIGMKNALDYSPGRPRSEKRVKTQAIPLVWSRRTV